MDILIFLLAGFYVGWNIGANDAANCIGTAVGSGILKYRKSIILVAIFAMLGAYLQGHYVMGTIGKGIVATVLPSLAILVALLSAGFFVTLATFFKIPVSTSQAVVGGVLGVGIGAFGFHSEYIQYEMLMKILLTWVLSPVLTMMLSLLLYTGLTYFLRRVKNVLLWNKILSMATILSACYLAYSLGANNVGNAVGPLLNMFPGRGQELSILGGIALAVGALTFGRRVTETVGKNITPLDITGAFSAQLIGGFGIHLFAMLGIPVSTSQAVVGAIIGVGLARGIKVISTRQIVQIVIGWIAAPTGAVIFSYTVYTLAKPLL